MKNAFGVSLAIILFLTGSIASGRSADCFPPSIWTGKVSIAWGGDEFCGPSSKGTQSNGVPLVSVVAPSARFAHTLVWTGKNMIVWGGKDHETYFNTGAIYHPETDSWVTISTINAPEARAYHHARWTGKKMLICGGNDGETVFEGCATYDPANNIWE